MTIDVTNGLVVMKGGGWSWKVAGFAGGSVQHFYHGNWSSAAFKPR